MDKDLEILLGEYRNQIDSIDKEIVYLLSRRFNLVKSIGDIKKENNISILQKDRWQIVLNKLKENSENFGVNYNFLVSIWNLIHQEAIKIEKNK